MGKHVIVDGFNVIRRDPELSGIERANFYGAQEILNQKLSRYRMGTSHRVTVVYDGANSPNPFRHRMQRYNVEVIYSAQGETADEVIQDMVTSSGGDRSGILVVTADRALADYCRGQRVNVAPPDELLRKSRQAGRMPSSADFAHGKHEEQGWVGHTRKTGNSRRLPKAKRKPSGLW